MTTVQAYLRRAASAQLKQEASGQHLGYKKQSATSLTESNRLSLFLEYPDYRPNRNFMEDFNYRA